MVPAIAWSVSVKATVPILTVCMLVGNSARVWFSRHDIVWRVVFLFLVGSVPMTMFGTTLYTRIDSVWLSRMMGAFMILAVPLRRLLAHSGVTVHWMDENLDTGDIAEQAPLHLPDGIAGPKADELCAKAGGEF